MRSSNEKWPPDLDVTGGREYRLRLLSPGSGGQPECSHFLDSEVQANLEVAFLVFSDAFRENALVTALPDKVLGLDGMLSTS
jgi:hypothetical protein